MINNNLIVTNLINFKIHFYRMNQLSLKKFVPNDLEFEEVNYEDAIRRKLGMHDSTLRRYYENDKVQVYEVEPSGSNGDLIPELVIEKNPNRMPNEVVFGILADEIGAGPEILYLRDEGDGISYGMPFLTDYGMFRDLDLNSVPDLHDYAEAVGEAFAGLYMADIMHEDLIGMTTTGRFSHTPFLRNFMVSGSKDRATIIDYEDAHLGEKPPMKDHENPHIRELVPADREDEYEAIEAAIFCDAIREFSEFWDEAAGHRIKNREFVDHDDLKQLDFVNIDKFVRIFDSNPEIRSAVREIEQSFERGLHSGTRDSGADELYEAVRSSEIDLNHEPRNNLRDAVRARKSEDIEPFLERSI